MVPGKTFHGRTTFEWIEDGAFLMARSHIDEPEIPDGISIFGTDDARGGTMLYFDVRAVSREYRWTLDGDLWTWSRDDEKLAQRMALEISETRIVARGRMSRDGGPWEPDLALTYTRG